MRSRLLLTMVMVFATLDAFGQTAAPSDKAKRCAIRLAISVTGKSPTSALLGQVDPQTQVDALLATPDFIESFSRFVNAMFNDEPGATSAEDSAYHLTRYLLTNGKGWEDLFLGPYKVDVDPADKTKVLVSNDANGLGYFRSLPWLKRYAGNELAGIKISTAYRMLNNTLGIKLQAVTNTDGLDISAAGRESPACRGCHYDGWFALDKTASVLTRRNGTGDSMKFDPPTAGPQQLLGGITIANDKELMTALVKSEAFRFNACRLAFQYLYGRAERTCEGPVFDTCMAAYAKAGTIQSALAAVAKDATFCQ